MNQVFTCGYSGHTVAQLKQAAEAWNARVLDIRLSPKSMRPEWNEEALKQLLGWRYYHLGALGNDNYKNDGPIKIHNPKLGIDIVEQLLCTKSLILLCGCADYHSCHRAVVSQMLRARRIITQELAWPEVETVGAIKALSIKQPWAHLIVSGKKDIENRSWATNYRGRVLIHASKGMTHDDYDSCLALCDVLQVEIPPMENLERGGIVGEATLVDCVTESKSPWFFGEYGFVLANAKPLPFVPYRGALGFFNVPVDILKADAN